MEQVLLRVSDLIALVNQTLEYAYSSVAVEGEVSSFKVSKGKYVFFDLKDDTGVVNCFMMVYQLRTALEDGMKVRVVAQPRLTAWGKFSLNIREAMPVGEGSIKRSFELLRAKLEKEGLFDPARKRSLPSIPERIGLIASVESAGYADFVKVMGQRWGGVSIVVADVLVQGVEASGQIVAALQHFNEQADPVEVVVIARGGGSAEDLAVFNEEPLVRTIAASRIPTMVGVGHETDISLADLAADVRAATPSNAAQLLVPDRTAVMRDIQHKRQRMFVNLLSRHHQLAEQTGRSIDRLLVCLQTALRVQQQHVGSARQTLRQLDPKVILRRGYGIVRDERGRLVRGAVSLRPGAQIAIELEQSIIKAGVEDVQFKR